MLLIKGRSKLLLCLALILGLALPGAANAASLTATPAIPWPGASLRLQASGFQAHARGVATLSGVAPLSFRVDSGGRARLAIPVPGRVRRGVHSLRIRAGGRTVATTVSVVAARRATSTLVARASGQRVLLDPARGAVGARFTIRATGLRRLAPILVRFNGKVVARKRTNARGASTLRASVPGVGRGRRNVRVLSGSFSASLPFVVVAPTSLVPPPPDTTGPTVSITAPAAGSTFSGETVAVNASASDNVGVAGVQFRLDGNVLGAEDTSAPYSTNWNTSTASGASHTLTAVARDAAANSTTSSAVTVTVIDKTPPAVSITAPPAAGSVSGTLVVRATATDNTAVSSVEFFRDPPGASPPVSLGTDTSAPYVAPTTWNSTTVADAAGQAFSASARDSAGNQATSAVVNVTVKNNPRSAIAAAGDIACSPNDPSFATCQQTATSMLVVGKGYSDVLTLGDTQYDCASATDFAGSFDPTWGQVKSIIHPATGNHEYKDTNPDDYGANVCVANAGGYFGYFGSAAGDPAKGYYSFDIGPYWHVVSLNTNLADTGVCLVVSCAAGDPQEAWLKADLAANSSKPCTIAIWHQPMFTSKTGNQSVRAFWDDLYAAGAELVLNGHVHNYERFDPQRPDGTADPVTGITEFIAGTGGKSVEGSLPAGGVPAPNSAVRGSAFGILELTLRPTSYDYRFVPVVAGSINDASAASVPCH